MGAIDTILNVSDKLGFIEGIKWKVIKNPDQAAEKLAIVLEEMMKNFSAIQAELTNYLSLSFDTEDSKDDARRILLDLESGQLRARLYAARGHCQKINNIYQKFLNPWFQRFLELQEMEKADELFAAMQGGDWEMLQAIDSLATWLAEKAGGTLNFLEANKLKEASETIKDARMEIVKERMELSKLMGRMYRLQGEIIAAIGTV